MKKIFRVLAVLTFSVLLIAGTASATPMLDFRNGLLPQGGVIELLTGGNVKGENIPIGALEVFDTPLNVGTFITGAVFNFNTAAGTMNIYGTAVGIGPVELVNGTSITSFTVSGSNAAGLDIHITGTDTKNPDMLAYFGLDRLTAFDFVAVELTTSSLIDQVRGTDYYKALSTDIRNTQVPEVPEPASMLLLGLGLLGVAAIKRKF